MPQPRCHKLVVYFFYTFSHIRERRQLQRDPSLRQKGRPQLVVGTFLVATLVPGLPSLSGYGRTVRQLRKVWQHPAGDTPEANSADPGTRVGYLRASLA